MGQQQDARQAEQPQLYDHEGRHNAAVGYTTGQVRRPQPQQRSELQRWRRGRVWQPREERSDQAC